MTYEQAGQDVLEYIGKAHLLRGVVLAGGASLEGRLTPQWSQNAAEQVGELIRSAINHGLEDDAGHDHAEKTNGR